MPSLTRDLAPRRQTQGDRARRRSHAAAILAALQAAGARGCSNLELWRLAHAGNSRVSDLRAHGHNIACQRDGANGRYRYLLLEPAPKTSVSGLAAPGLAEADVSPRTKDAPAESAIQTQAPADPAPIAASPKNGPARAARTLPLFDLEMRRGPRIP